MKNSVKIFGLVAVIVVLFSNLIEKQDANLEKSIAMNSAQNKEVTKEKKHIGPHLIVKRDL